MSDPCAAAVHAAELAVFQRKELMLKAASSSGLPGRFGSFHLGGLRASLATEPHYDFLNVVECVNNETLPALADTLDRFDAQNRPTVVATSPSPRLIARLRGDGYEPAPARPIAYMSLHAIHPNDTITEPWQIREVATRQDQIRFAALLEAGYEANNDVRSLIRAEHARPEIRAFIALRDNQPVAAAAMSVHRTGAVLGGASTLPPARGTGAQSALLLHRLRVARALGCTLATASAAPGSPSIRNLARLGFTVVERTAWRLTPPTADEAVVRRNTGEPLSGAQNVV